MSLSLSDAIKHCEEVAEKYCEKVEEGLTADDFCDSCASEHRQLAEWLRELKAYKNSPVLQRWLKQCDTCKYQHKKASEPPCRRCCHTYSNKHEEVNADDT